LVHLIDVAWKIIMLPQSLEAATGRMVRPDSIAREVFGNEFVDHFGGTREHEIKLWNEAVTSWEGESEVMMLSMRRLIRKQWSATWS
jgi:glutamine synthetase